MHGWSFRRLVGLPLTLLDNRLGLSRLIGHVLLDELQVLVKGDFLLQMHDAVRVGGTGRQYVVLMLHGDLLLHQVDGSCLLERHGSLFLHPANAVPGYGLAAHATQD